MRRASPRCTRPSKLDDAVTSSGATSMVLIFAAIAATPILTDLLGSELPLVVVITSIGVEADRLEPGKAAALVTAAMLSVLIHPVAAGALRGRTASPAVEEAVEA